MYSSTIQYNTIILEPKRCLFRSRSPPYPALPSEHHSQFSPSIPVWVFSTHASLLLCYQLSWKSSPPTITSYHHGDLNVHLENPTLPVSPPFLDILSVW